MDKHESASFSFSSGTDLAFALVVFISYFANFSQTQTLSLFLIIVLICLGIAYITLGIYGFSFINKSKWVIGKILYFVLQLIIGGLIIYYGRGAGFNALILLPLVTHTVIVLDQDLMFAANAGIIATYALAIYSYSGSWQEVINQMPLFFAGQVFILFFTQMALTERKARMKTEKMAAELAEANRHLSEYAEQVKELTLSQERNRLAREIHDGLGHYLTTINMQIKAATAMIGKDNDQALHMLHNAQYLSSEALVDVRNSVSALRADTKEGGLLEDRIKKLIESTFTKDVDIQFTTRGERRSITPQVDLTIFRACQEALNNALKHSNANRITILLDYSDSQSLQLTVEDNGKGAEELDGGFGLIGIQERARLAKGTVQVVTKEGQGFSLILNIPG